MEKFAPIIIFAFNRLDTLKACVESLKRNKEAILSDLIVYVDGPREARKGEAAKVEKVRNYVESISGFHSVEKHISKTNKGLAASIISGVSDAMKKYGKAIVVEDDLYLAPSFLSYMNYMLDYFEKDKRIFQVSGYSSLIADRRKPASDVYLNARGQCWSWGTWKDRWNTIDWQIRDFDDFCNDKQARKKWSNVGHDLFGMLNSWKQGRLNSWWIRFSYNMFRQQRYTICPVNSLVRNDGFGADSSHCNAYNRYRIEFDDMVHQQYHIPENLTWDANFNHYATRYWSLPYRIYGKAMTYIYRVLGIGFDGRKNGN